MLHNQILHVAERLGHVRAADADDARLLSLAALNLQGIAESLACLEAYVNPVTQKEQNHVA